MAQRLTLSSRSTWYTRLIDLGLGWITLLAIVLFVGLIWRRIGNWSATRLDPALDALRVASGGMAARAGGSEMTAFSRHKHLGQDPLPIALCGSRWVTPGGVFALDSDEEDPMGHVVEELLQDERTAVVVVSDQTDLKAIGVRLAASGNGLAASAEGRLFWAGSPSLATMPDGLLFDAARTGFLPVLVIDERAVESVGTKAPLARLAERLRPTAIRVHGAAIVLTAPPDSGRQALDRVRVWREGLLA
jgi:hypothetical protein